MQGNRGAAALAGALAGLVHQQTERPDQLELGEVQQDMSLLLDHFRVPLPPVAYLVTERVASLVPPLAPGNRVLVAWCNNGTDPVIIDRVVSS